jgi:tetratricopeptide (TPR) repeat protein
MSIFFFKQSLSAFSIVLVALALQGCKPSVSMSKKREPMIPREETASAQFEVAFAQEREAKGFFDEAKRNEELETAIIAYTKVEAWFPNDDRYTPVAGLKVAEIHEELEDYEQAEANYRRLLEVYPNDEEIRAYALLGVGRTLDLQDRPEEAQVFYKLLIDEFSTTTNPRYKQLVEDARNRYRQIR